MGGAAFVVCGIGSLDGACIRWAAQEEETRLDGPFEILSLSGSLSQRGAHLDMAISDAQGNVLGGHMCYGNRVRTTAEVLVARLEGWVLDRELDEQTGYHELIIVPRTRGGGPAGAPFLIDVTFAVIRLRAPYFIDSSVSRAARADADGTSAARTDDDSKRCS